MYDKGARADVAIAEIARRQHGIVSARQLTAAGLDKHRVLHRTRTGRLHRVHRGVYAVGHGGLSLHGEFMAAVLACGGKDLAATAGCGGASGTGQAATGEDSGLRTALDFWGAALSHRSAACLWGLLSPRAGPVDVSVRGGGGKKRRQGIRVHRSASLAAADVTLREGIPVTTPARTISDLRKTAAGQRGGVAPRELRRAIRQADVLGLPIGSPPERDRSRSDLERDFLRLCRRHRLLAPEVNVRVGRYLVDFLWRDRCLVVETDSYLYHRGQIAFQDDRRRDLNLRALGYGVIRVSEKQLDEEPEPVAEVIRTELRRPAAPRSDL